MKIDQSRWEKFNPGRAVNVGLNHLRLIPELLYDFYPEFKQYKVGVFDSDDVSLAHASGWEFLRKENFPDVTDFESFFPARFSLRVSEDGTIKFRDQWVMYMPWWVAEGREKARLELSDNRFKAVAKTNTEQVIQTQKVGGETYSVVDGEFEYEEESVEVSPQQDKRKPGRPKKSG